MRVWKIEAAPDQDFCGSRWGYVLAKSAEEALAQATAATKLGFVRVHEKHPNMRWPGTPGETVTWTS